MCINYKNAHVHNYSCSVASCITTYFATLYLYMCVGQWKKVISFLTGSSKASCQLVLIACPSRNVKTHLLPPPPGPPLFSSPLLSLYFSTAYVTHSELAREVLALQRRGYTRAIATSGPMQRGYTSSYADTTTTAA